MTARVLVVDDIAANVKLLEARLNAEYFEVVTATDGLAALDICARNKCDLVLLDIMMPGMDGFEVCRRIKSNSLTAHIPVIMVTALDQASDRVTGLEAGADDFLTKPINELALITRVKSLIRLKTLTDQLMIRDSTTGQLSLGEVVDRNALSGDHGAILLVEDKPSLQRRIVDALAPVHDIEIEGDPGEAMFRAAEGGYELVIVSLDLTGFDGLRLCSQIRSLDRTRSLPILVVGHPDGAQMLVRALDIGVNDYIMTPIDKNELLARVRTQIRRHRFSERLRDGLHMSVEMAVTDGLTGLHNRRYLERHLSGLIDGAMSRGRPLSLLLLDIDLFKSVNDTYGHEAGDDVLREFSTRIRTAVRHMDLVCRLGGEEFVVVMPDTEAAHAVKVGERIRHRIASQAFLLQGGETSLSVTVSIGLAGKTAGSDTPEGLLRRADEALYEAKRNGRNRVATAA